VAFSRAMRAAVLLLIVGAFLRQAGGPALPGNPVVEGYPYAGACPGAGYADNVDRWNMYECNCTSYVAWALARNGQRVDWFVAGAMDARRWPAVARSAGLETGRLARVGAVAVWPRAAPPYGHLGYVTHVSGGRFDVTEYNLLRPYAFDRRTGLSGQGVVFIYVPVRLR
jgi:surface antigen